MAQAKAKAKTKSSPVEPKKKRGPGRKLEYDPVKSAQVARRVLALEGTETDVAAALGVSRKTVAQWKAKYPDFGLAVAEAKAKVDHVAVSTLYRLAVGKMTLTEQKAVSVKDKLRIVTLKKSIPPDYRALALWVMNRLPAEFRAKQVIEHEGLDAPQVVLYQPDLASAPAPLRDFLSRNKPKTSESE